MKKLTTALFGALFVALFALGATAAHAADAKAKDEPAKAASAKATDKAASAADKTAAASAPAKKKEKKGGC